MRFLWAYDSCRGLQISLLRSAHVVLGGDALLIAHKGIDVETIGRTLAVAWVSSQFFFLGGGGGIQVRFW